MPVENIHNITTKVSSFVNPNKTSIQKNIDWNDSKLTFNIADKVSSNYVGQMLKNGFKNIENSESKQAITKKIVNSITPNIQSSTRHKIYNTKELHHSKVIPNQSLSDFGYKSGIERTQTNLQGVSNKSKNKISSSLYSERYPQFQLI